MAVADEEHLARHFIVCTSARGSKQVSVRRRDQRGEDEAGIRFRLPAFSRPLPSAHGRVREDYGEDYANMDYAEDANNGNLVG